MKNYKYLLICCSAMVVLMTILFFLSQSNTHRKNGFVRLFDTQPVEQIAATDLTFNSYYISGVAEEGISLGNYTAPLYFWSSDFRLKHRVNTRLPIGFTDQLNWGATLQQVHLPIIYLTDRTTPSIMKTSWPYHGQKLQNLSGMKFDMVKVLTPTTMIIRYYDFKVQQKVLEKVTLNPKPNRKYRFQPAKQSTGDFSVDGFLNYDRERGRLMYTYYYRNEFLCLDTNLVLLYKGITIDTNSLAKIEAADLKYDDRTERMHARPPLFVNKRGYASKGLFYIQSALASDQETKADFDRCSVIDIYSVENGLYVKSIRIPHYQNHQIKDFAVYADTIVAVHDRFLVVYKLP